MTVQPLFRPLVLLGILLSAMLTPLRAGAEETEEFTLKSRIMAGYRAFSTEGSSNRAAEYYFLDSGATLGIDLRGGTRTQRLMASGEYLNKNDFRSEGHYNNSGLLRLDLRSERFYHQLDHIPYVPGREDARQNAFTVDPATAEETLRVVFSDRNPEEKHGLRLDIMEARARGKLRTYPAHLNLRYWRFEKKGDRQLRFVEEGSELPGGDSCNTCHMQSGKLHLDRVTEEFVAGVDAHLGPIDVIVEQLIRQFREREPAPVDLFSGHPFRPAGHYPHDAVPDSRLTETSFKAHTSHSGGIVGAGSFSIGRRENRADLAAGQPFGVAADRPETDYYKAAGDLTWMPSPRWSVNLRYRFLDLDADNPSRLAAYGEEYNVRDSIDLRRSSHEAAVTYRPVRRLTLKGEYQVERLHRGNTGGPEPHDGTAAAADTPGGTVIDDVWELPEDEVRQRIRVTMLLRPFADRKLKVNLRGQYGNSNDPAYGASFASRYEIFAGATYAPSLLWGIHLSGKAAFEENDRHKRFLFASGAPQPVEFDREGERQQVSFGVWLTPMNGLSVGIDYAYLRSRLRQDLLFGSDPGEPPSVADHVIEDERVEYSQKVHTFSANTSLRLDEAIILRLEGYHIRSQADFSPGFSLASPPLDFPASSAALRDLSQVDIRQNGLGAGLEWTPAADWTWSLRLAWDDYEDRGRNVFDGTVSTAMATVARLW